ncbi:MAG: hypothetical protein ACRDK0_14490 [Solirubrobacteraceae bacterium]
MARHGSRRLPTPSMAVAITALVVALGGTSYAVVKPSPRSVGAKELKRKAVSGVHIKANAINSSKVKDGSLTGKDVVESSLGQVALAARATVADRATTATSVDQAARAGVAAGLDRVVYRVATASVPPAPDVNNSTRGVATARCDAGQLVVGGGVKLAEESMSVVDSFPDGAAAWTSNANNDDPAAAHSFTVFAICVTAATPG